MTPSCEDGNELSGCIEGGAFLHLVEQIEVSQELYAMELVTNEVVVSGKKLRFSLAIAFVLAITKPQLIEIYQHMHNLAATTKNSNSAP
jgi:hypothetical protein